MSQVDLVRSQSCRFRTNRPFYLLVLSILILTLFYILYFHYDKTRHQEETHGKNCLGGSFDNGLVTGVSVKVYRCVVWGESIYFDFFTLLLRYLAVFIFFALRRWFSLQTLTLSVR